MAALANHKHELFAQALAKGEPACTAYVSAGYAYNEGNSVRLKGNEKVIARVAELQERAAAKVELTLADLVEMLAEDRKFARQCEQSGSAVTASMGIAKLLGFLKDKIESTVTVRADYSAQVEAEIAEIIGRPTPHLIEVKHG
jgi:phage terminase small subunit